MLELRVNFRGKLKSLQQPTRPYSLRDLSWPLPCHPHMTSQTSPTTLHIPHLLQPHWLNTLSVLPASGLCTGSALCLFQNIFIANILISFESVQMAHSQWGLSWHHLKFQPFSLPAVGGGTVVLFTVQSIVLFSFSNSGTILAHSSPSACTYLMLKHWRNERLLNVQGCWNEVTAKRQGLNSRAAGALTLPPFGSVTLGSVKWESDHVSSQTFVRLKRLSSNATTSENLSWPPSLK
jgi:hypothetical protein